MKNGRTLRQRLRWRLKQAAAGESRYYGDGGTIHQTGYLDVETRDGEVVAVWFRCQQLPFKQTEVNLDRAAEMRAFSEAMDTAEVRITGIEIDDQ